MIEITYESRTHLHRVEIYKNIEDANTGMQRMWKESHGWWMPISAVRIHHIDERDTVVEKVLRVVSTFHIEENK